MWTLVIIGLSTPLMQGGFASSQACVAGYPAAKQSIPIVDVQQAYCQSAGAAPVWIVKDGTPQ